MSLTSISYFHIWLIASCVVILTSTPCLLTEAQEVICIINYYFRPQIFEFLYNFVSCKFVMSNKICKTIANQNVI